MKNRTLKETLFIYSPIRLVLFLSLIFAHSIALGQKDYWRDQSVVHVNTEPPRASFSVISGSSDSQKNPSAEHRKSLNGEWFFRWSESHDARPVNFWREDFSLVDWDLITVPSVWEREGHGYPVYINHGYPFDAEPFTVPVDEQNHSGAYVTEFTIPASWENQRVYVDFGAVSSAMTLWINGEEVGYSQGSRTPINFEITDYIREGSNRLAAEVMRFSDGNWLENQDSWSLTGIFRDVNLYVRAPAHIRDFFAKTYLKDNYTTGLLNISGELDINTTQDNIPQSLEIILRDHEDILARQVIDIKSAVDGQAFDANLEVRDIEVWSAENPNLYEINLILRDPEQREIETVGHAIGFRSVELNNGRVLINGHPVIFKGVNLHEFHPDNGYVVDEETMLRDLTLMKEANINAIRTSHYPQSRRFYELTDRFGFYVVDEANLETHLFRNDPALAPALKPEWKDQMLDRMQRTLERDKNHASVIMWSPGNETGMGPNMTAIYEWVKARDDSRIYMYADDTLVEHDGVRALQDRWEFGKASDVLASFYPSPWELEEFAQTRSDETWIMAEYWHSMGNSLGNGRDYWEKINRYENLQGGFIWDWVDQGLREVNADGEVWWGHGGDYGPEGVPSSANFVHNGIVFPDRQVKPAFWEVKRAHQPVAFEAHNLSKAVVTVENRFDFVDLNEFSLRWQLLENGVVVKAGDVDLPSVVPGDSVRITLPKKARRFDASRGEHHLNVHLVGNRERGLLPAGHVYGSEQFAFPAAADLVYSMAEQGSESIVETDESYQLAVGGLNITVCKSTGFICSIVSDGSEYLSSPIVPEFWRAMTDNDYGQLYQNSFGYSPQTWDLAWRKAGENAQLLSITFDEVGDRAKITSIFNINPSSDVKQRLTRLAQLIIEYSVLDSGELLVQVAFTRDDNTPMPLRLGVRANLNSSLENLAWFGRGPHENYSDRNWSALLGQYESDVSEQFVPYLRPQENGYKTNSRWFSLTSSSGDGLIFSGMPHLNFSALPYPREAYEAPGEVLSTDLVSVRDRHPMRITDLPKEKGVHVHIDYDQAGVGGDNSWGKRAYTSNTLAELNYRYAFRIAAFKR